ncbi:cold shock and DUF1294 domain-containing protein [Methylophaga sp.]|uniref:cold shock and DUF1294 domain-containing protein n=1 Tax=Methylophaga sp. TaxID=2024840 RepID=UPI002719C4A4|nr:cold shock and DUF1294 domain-containing protein [Methylophaga sp.]MDO8825945.1 cold shock and DUF1294 domain-containing protein [Methylophaga sp.]
MLAAKKSREGMKLQGKISNWNDDRGFGFVEPNGGGERAFVHIKAFNPPSRRPVNGEVIIYEIAHDNNNRYKAENIQFARDISKSKKRDKVKSQRGFGGVFTIIFFIGLLVSVLSGKLPLVIVGLYLLMSLIAFIAYAMDKSAAQDGRWRIPEDTLHLISLMGGWPGASVAQKKLRHKSSKKAFINVYWVTVLLNLAGLFWLHTENGANFINNVVFPLFNG